MNSQDLIIGLLATRLMQQNETIQNMDTMLRELIDRVDSVGDSLWRMERRRSLTASTRKRAAKKRQLARKSSYRKHGSK